MKRVSVGVIGCGNISAAYLKAAKTFPILDIVALSDMNFATAEARSAEFGVPAKSVETVLADPVIEVILNLTVPKAHVEVGLKAIAAGHGTLATSQRVQSATRENRLGVVDNQLVAALQRSLERRA